MIEKYRLNSEENKEYLKFLREELIEFGKKFPSESGSSYYLGDDGTPWKERPRETWITCRMAHVYSIGKMLGMNGCYELAKAAVNGLNTELHDDNSDGWYAGIDNNGKPLPDKQCYAHAFVILAGTSAVLAGVDGARELLDKALKVYDEKFFNKEEGLSVDTWSTDFSELSDYRGLNANMHTVEAFLAVADVENNESYRVRAGKIVDRVIGWAENNNWRIPEHFNSSWIPDLECNKDNPADQFKPYGATPGHGIEWARLITQWAVSSFGSESEKIKKYIEASEKLYNTAISDSWNRNGKPGIAYTTDWDGNPVVTDRMHWTLAEAINTSSVLYKITGDEKYSDDYYMFMEYLDKYVHDKENGSWFHQLDENNNVIGTVWPGKSDLYHAFQATLIPYSNVSVSIAKAVLINEQ
ncbi:MAG: AGE family epimerase/isomerase [Lachnospiraceae bacterium]|nr:AGE family epimerase/isomerase [Lachnospiraceae bacterium]